ncbi:hypothetical protein RA210_U250044 [Rubrivivax sp. A210]|uniref:DUF1173 family protein n=1 Tax=Rubrivivax sp. A210 TaxID=2772301 RepID=UPI0019197D30|nr:DUF1173 family protein [Rubrivivax sp. A210]CAD5372945.1 hypothetical protein RA210_U250044 [Rubrivivax sp. A210]
MYRITQNGTRTLFGRSTLQETVVQRMLRAATQPMGSVTCLCKGEPGAPLQVKEVNGNIYLARKDGTAGQHLSGCFHSSSAAFGQAFGFEPGTVTEVKGKFEINLRSLLEDPKSSGGTGRNGSTRRHPPALLSLLWLILVRSGLNVFHTSLCHRNEWQEFQFGASDIVLVSGSDRIPLNSLLLLPESTSSTQFATNRERLQAALIRDGRIFFAAIFPNESRFSASKNKFINVMPGGRPPVLIEKDELPSHMRRYREEEKRWKNGCNLLMLATGKAAKARNPGTGEPEIVILQKMAFLPVDLTLAPVPTSSLEQELSRCRKRDELYAVGPEHDKHLAVGRKS